MASQSSPSESCNECAKYSSELADVKAMLMSMESNHAEIVKELKRQHDDEVATMQVLLNEAAAEASTNTRRSFEQERTKLFESNNDMEKEIGRLRKLVVESARSLQHQQAEMESPNRSNTDHRDSNLSSTSAQMFEDEIEMLKIQLATANQEITKLTLEKERMSKPVSPEPVPEPNLVDLLAPDEATVVAERLTEAENQSQNLLSKLNRAESELALLRASTTEVFERSKLELARLSDKFRSVVEVNRRLTFYYAKKSQEMREEEINLPPTFDELLSCALMLREQVILERANRELLKEKTSQEIDLLRSELQAEQNERQQMEQILSSEIDTLRQDLTRERSMSRTKSVSGIQLSSVSMDETSPKARASNDSEVESLRHSKAALEAEVNGLRQQCTRLQVELDTSESVQQDLVRLSQSLQVSLESLRDQSEVRWEFDDEVDQCRACKKTLPVNQKKQHCRHCGKIFCDSCLAQSVASGAARRPAQVCTQCHFLLVQESKPYFNAMSDQQ